MRACLSSRRLVSSLLRHQRRALHDDTMSKLGLKDSRLGISPDIIAFLQQDIDLRPSTLRRWAHRQKWLQLKQEHKYDVLAVAEMGPDIAAAHVVVRHGGSVKFVGKDEWFHKNEDGQTFIPNKLVGGFRLEAVDASHTTFMYPTLEYFERLESLVYLNLSECPHVDDWCLSRLHMLGDTLRFLNVSGCSRVTERGLATLHHLPNLEGLSMCDMPRVKNLELMTILVEEMLPKCTVIGPDYSDADRREHPAQTSKQSEVPLISERVMAAVKGNSSLGDDDKLPLESRT